METAILLVLLYILLSPKIAQKFYNCLLFFPDKEQEDLYGVRSVAGFSLEDQTFTSHSGKELHGWLLKNPNSDKLILVNHGNAGNISHRAWLAKLLVESGSSVFLYDYQCYGRSTGNPSIFGITQDGLAAFDFAAEKLGYKQENIVLFGESLGSGVACHIAMARPNGGLILQSPFSSLRHIACEKLPWLRLYPNPLMVTPDLDNLTALKNYKQPVLIIHGKMDKTVPFYHGERLFKIAGENKKFICLPTAGHNDVYDCDPLTYTETIKVFLSNI